MIRKISMLINLQICTFNKRRRQYRLKAFEEKAAGTTLIYDVFDAVVTLARIIKLLFKST
jgi:hypothetical protein